MQLVALALGLFLMSNIKDRMFVIATIADCIAFINLYKKKDKTLSFTTAEDEHSVSISIS